MINELIETEQDYVKDLGSIVEVRSTFLFNSLSASGNLKPDTHDETFVCNFCMQLLCVSYTTVHTMKLLYATSHYLLLFPAKIMHNLSTWCEIVVPLCLIVIALAMQHLNGPRIIRSCWTRRWIQRRNVYRAHHIVLS